MARTIGEGEVDGDDLVSQLGELDDSRDDRDDSDGERDPRREVEGDEDGTSRVDEEAEDVQELQPQRELLAALFIVLNQWAHLARSRRQPVWVGEW